MLFGRSLPRIWTGRTVILCPVLRPSRKTSLCVFLPLFYSLLFHLHVCMFVVPSCRITPASFRFDSASTFVIFYYFFFPLCTYYIFTISFLLFVIFFCLLLYSCLFFFPVYSVVSCSVSARLICTPFVTEVDIYLLSRTTNNNAICQFAG